MLSLFCPQLNTVSKHRSYATSYKRILRKDLQQRQLNKLDPEVEPEKFKKAMVKNLTWFKEVPARSLRKVMLLSLEKHGHLYDRGGIKVGYLKILLQKAEDVEDLSAVVEILSIVQNREIDFVVDSITVELFCKACARMKIPEMGFTFLTLNFLKMDITTAAVAHVLNGFAETTEKAYLYKAMVNDQFRLEIPDAVPVYDEEKELPDIMYNDFRKRSKPNKRLMEYVAITYSLLREHHNSHLKPNRDVYSACVRFFAALGHIEQADIFWNEMKKNSMKPTMEAINTLMLAHIWKDSADTVFSEKFENVHVRPATALFAAYIAKGDEENALATLKSTTKVTKEFFNVHFDSEERVELIQSVFEKAELEDEELSTHVGELSAELEELEEE